MNLAPSELDLIANSVNKTLRNIPSSFFNAVIAYLLHTVQTTQAHHLLKGLLLRLVGEFNKLKLKLRKSFFLESTPLRSVTLCRKGVDRGLRKRERGKQGGRLYHN